MKNKILSTPLLAIVACLLWSTAFVGVKTGLKYSPPIQFAGIRFFLSGLLILPLVRDYGQFIKMPFKQPKGIFLVALFQTFVLYSLFYWGVNLVPGAVAAIVIGSQPLFAAIIAHVMLKNDQLSLKKFLLFLIGVLGIGMIAIKRGFGNGMNVDVMLGIGILVAANIASGIGNVIVSKQRDKISPLMLSSWQMIIGGVALMVFSYFIEPFGGVDFPLEYFAVLGWLSFISAAAFSIWFILLQRPGVKVSSLNGWKFIIPFFGAILSWLLLSNESPDLITVIGMVVIISSLIMHNRMNMKN